MSENVSIIALPKSDVIFDSFAVVSGWGCTASVCLNRTISKTLQKLTVEILEKNLCEIVFKKQFYAKSQFCANGLKRYESTFAVNNVFITRPR